MAILAIDIMKNHIRHRLYPQKIAENEEKNKLRTEELRNTLSAHINKMASLSWCHLCFALASSNLLSP
jgi:hypothetical protein